MKIGIKRKILVSAVSIICFLGGCSPNAAVSILPSTAIQETTTVDKAFIWKAVKDDNPNKVVFLLGSIHMGTKDSFPLNEVIEQAYQNSDKLVVEVDITTGSQQEMAAKVLSIAMLPKGSTLETIVSEDTWAALVDFIAKHNMPKESFLRFKPWFAAITVATLRMNDLGYSQEFGIDRYFLKKAQKPVLELETVDSQLSLFDNMSVELQELMLEDALSGNMQVSQNPKLLFNAWRTGNTAAMENIIMSEVRAEPKFSPFLKVLLTDRNLVMKNTLDTFLISENKLLVVVGAAHLVGKLGLVSLFKKTGWTVKQLDQSKTHNALNTQQGN